MSVVINSNFAATLAANNLAANGQLLQKSLHRLSSGSKIANPSDDAGGLAVSMKLSAAAKRQSAASTNISNSISFLQTQDGVLKAAGHVLERMSELKMLSLDPTKNALDRANYLTEFTKLQAQLNALDREKFNGIDLFGYDAIEVSLDEAGRSTLDIGNTSLAGPIVPEFTPFADSFNNFNAWTDVSFAAGSPTVANNTLTLSSGPIGGFGAARSNQTFTGAFQITLDVRQATAGGLFSVWIGNEVLVSAYGASNGNYHSMRIEFDGNGNAEAYLDQSSTPFQTRSGIVNNGGSIRLEQFGGTNTTAEVKNLSMLSTSVDPSEFKAIQLAANLDSVGLDTFTTAIQEIATHRTNNGARKRVSASLMSYCT